MGPRLIFGSRLSATSVSANKLQAAPTHSVGGAHNEGEAFCGAEWLQVGDDHLRNEV